MKTQLPVVVILALGLQAFTAANNPAAAESIFEGTLVGAQDEVWGIGRRVANADTPSAPSTQTEPALATLEELEFAFWACDYIATIRGVEATPVAICGAVYDDLKAMKFSGDFNGLLDWWKQNKAMEHQRLAAEFPDVAVEHIEIRY